MAIQFLQVTPEQAEAKVLTGLKAALKKYERVLWIITGGSNLAMIAQIMDKISGTESAKLAIMLSDERFGPIGFPDSNLKQLYDAGFKPKRATVVPVLRPGVLLKETTEFYDEAVRTAFAAADFTFAQLGMGPDGHVAGILPGSPATKPTKKWVMSYETPEFTRITLTPFALSRLSEAFLPVFGKAKKTALENLRDKQLTISKQPAQLLKKLPIVAVLNDQIGDKS